MNFAHAARVRQRGIDFFGTACSKPARKDTLFGLCDDQNSTKAYSTKTDQETWIATVINEDAIEVVFTAIDHCLGIMKPDTKDEDSTCDGMLTSSNSLYLVELKAQKNRATSDAFQQLENTVKLLLDNENLSAYRYKKVFACNKKHPHLRSIENERSNKFYKDYGFRLDSQATILIK